jgi:hypothetical protein
VRRYSVKKKLKEKTIMKRWLTILFVALISFSTLPSDYAFAGDRDPNPTMKMNSRKRSKYMAKLRKQQDRDRKKHLADIKKSQPKKKGSKVSTPAPEPAQPSTPEQ